MAVSSPLVRGATLVACTRSVIAYPGWGNSLRLCGTHRNCRAVHATQNHITFCTATAELLTYQQDMTVSAADLHTQQAWKFWKKLGSPKYHVAPMVDQVLSETCFSIVAYL